MKVIHFFYTIAIYLYGIVLWIAHFFSPKAQHWFTGRKNWKEKLQQSISKLDTRKNTERIWIHCASLGEFEQGRPLIEKLKKEKNCQIVLTFFSPSGYEVRKNYELADIVAYLPLDTPSNARFFVHILQPDKVFFVKYELWANFIFEIKKRQIPLYLIAAKWRKGNNIFRFPASLFYTKILAAFTAVFTQDEATADLLDRTGFSPLNKNGLKPVLPVGDPRFDRIFATKSDFVPIPEIALFLAEKKENDLVLVVGSAWQPEESLILDIFPQIQHNTYIIIAPHEIDKDKINTQIQRFPKESIAFSEGRKNPSLLGQKKILWMDNIGMLARLYYYADIAFVGGGFSGELHNILEPCVFGNMILIGHKYKKHKFTEAADLIAKKCVFTVENETQLLNYLEKYRTSRNFRSHIQTANWKYVAENIGATEKIWQYLF